MVWEECGIGCGGGGEAVECFSLENLFVFWALESYFYICPLKMSEII